MDVKYHSIPFLIILVLLFTVYYYSPNETLVKH